MFGLMGQTDVLLSPDQMHYAIVPTIVIPFAIIGVVLSTLASVVAGFFGIELRAEGPRKLLELLLKPKLLAMMVLINLLAYGGVLAYHYVVNLPKPLWYISLRNQSTTSGALAAASESKYPDTQSSENFLVSKGHRLVFALDISWQAELPEGSFSGPLVAGPSVFVGADDGFIYELDRISGKTLRKFYVGTAVTPTPIIFNNKIYVGEGEHDTHHARIYSFDLNTGKFDGAFTTKGHTEASPRFARFRNDEYLIFPAGADGMYAVDPKTMTQRWHFPVIHTDSEVAVDEATGVVYFSSGVDKAGTMDGQSAYALNLVDGTLKWQRDLPTSGWTKPLLSGDKVCFSLGEIYVKRNYGQLACYRRSDGQPQKAVNATGPIVAYPLQIDNKLITMTTQGELCAWDSEHQVQLWCQKTKAPKMVYSTPNYDSLGNVVLQTYEEGIKIFNLETGDTELTWLPPQVQDNKIPWNRPSCALSIQSDGWYLTDWLGKNVWKLTPRYL